MPPKSTGEMLAAISNEMVRLKAQHYGKGAVEAKTYLNDDFLFVVLKGGMTKIEETLVDSGDEALVRQVRLRFQEQMTVAFTDAVEKVTGCKVLAHQSQVVFNPDYSFEIFLLDRNDEDPRDAADGGG
ncbi:MAG TPA: Na-translocating system protein MpsC family protein [Actinomycetota bacterium]|nr:Na-translocating system protein MpsC family protein [Actinomycetota bacterium]